MKQKFTESYKMFAYIWRKEAARVRPKLVDTSKKFYRPDQRCVNHSNSVGHDTEECINVEHKIQDLIDQEVVSLQVVAPNVNTNPFPYHGGVNFNMIETDDDWCVTKALDDIYVSVGTSSNNVAATINEASRGNLLIFCDNELPFEGRSHNKALHITVVCRQKIVNPVLVDDGTNLNICPLLTLRQLRFDLGKTFHPYGCVIYSSPDDEALLEDQRIGYSRRSDDLAPKTPIPAVYRMIATMMLQNSFEAGFRFGRNSQGISETILVPVKGARYSLGYVPTDDDIKMKKKNDQELAKTIPYLYQSFPVRDYTKFDKLGD
ncbi:hypothetical protein EJD97_019501 [Solanum chilense]|uniref:G-patch domain-containing protein n=1 Tax=Solanum chilense TaxID=4083 RepID=A0A6N2C6R2_SOLCI|nr:hypothetical protein EJD97_019501 [Solanum chilense]